MPFEWEQMVHIMLRLPAVLAISYHVGEGFQRIRLPAISGYLIAGLMSGPFLLGVLDENGLESVKFVDKLSLACIAFSAGSEMHLLEIRKTFVAVSSITLSITVFSWIFVCTTVMLLAEQVRSSTCQISQYALILCGKPSSNSQNYSDALLHVVCFTLIATAYTRGCIGIPWKYSVSGGTCVSCSIPRIYCANNHTKENASLDRRLSSCVI
jgi:Kef-type K+ transport system membrane component KefB